MPKLRAKIIGVGNPLMGDDGLGCKTIELLQQQQLPQGVSLIDAGCAGLQLLPLFENCERLIIIDAGDFSGQPGSFRILNNSDLEQLPAFRGQSSGHRIGLSEVLQVAHKLGKLPPLSLYLMQVGRCRPTDQFSAEIERALPGFAATIYSRLSTTTD